MPERRAPQPNDVYVYDGQEMVLLHQHTADGDVWICRMPNGSNTYVGAQFLAENQPLRLADGTVVAQAPQEDPAAATQAGATPATPEVAAPAAPAAAAAATPRRRNRGAERHEDPDEAGDVTTEQRCPACGVTFTGRLGADHACDAILAVKCARCNAIDVGALGQNVSSPHICLACIEAGFIVCKQCGSISGKSRMSTNYCARCGRIPPESVWFNMVSDRSAVGDSIVEVIRSHRPFAVEIESFMDASKVVRGARNIGPDTWQRATDGSIQPDPGCGQAVEFRSPPFRGDGGLAHLLDGMKKIRNMGYRANRSCGLHVHVDALDMHDSDKRALHKFGTWIQDDICKLVTPSRRGNNFCRMLGSFDEDVSDRYKWLNLSAYERHRTVENRLHHGTTLPERTLEWAKVCMLIVERGMKLGHLPARPAGQSLFDLLLFTPYQKNYWTRIAQKLHGRTVAFAVPAA